MSTLSTCPDDFGKKKMMDREKIVKNWKSLFGLGKGMKKVGLTGLSGPGKQHLNFLKQSCALQRSQEVGASKATRRKISDFFYNPESQSE